MVIFTHRSNQAVTAKAQGKRAKPSFQAGGWADKSLKQNGVKTGDREARGRQVRRMKFFNSCAWQQAQRLNRLTKWSKKK